MVSRHGLLECAILSVMWELEAGGTPACNVRMVYEALNEISIEKRAYTTVKTVMDRLFSKKIITKYKSDTKFLYRTIHSQKEMIAISLDEIANRYCGGSYSKLIEIINQKAQEEKKPATVG